MDRKIRVRMLHSQYTDGLIERFEDCFDACNRYYASSDIDEALAKCNLPKMNEVVEVTKEELTQLVYATRKAATEIYDHDGLCYEYLICTHSLDIAAPDDDDADLYLWPDCIYLD